jgi:Cu(I)/Ag(I) efflux system membrane protein CusA/SilA
MRRIAAPMVGGMLSVLVLAFAVIPVVFSLVRGWRLPEGPMGRAGDEAQR